MGHLLCFYLLELGMAAAWCRWVICREVDLPALLRTARTVWSGERQVLGELLLVRRRWTEGEETERFRQAWRRIALRLLPPLLYLTLGGALAPVLAWSMFPEGAGQLAMGCCVLAGLAGGCFKAGTQRTVEELSWMQGELEGLYAQILEMQHDFKHQIQVVESMLEQGECAESRQYLEQFRAHQPRAAALTGNLAVDALLTAKRSILQEKGIAFSFQAYPLQGCPLDDVELCTVLGNLLDNAMEGVGRLRPEQIRGWLGKVARNRALNRLRASREVLALEEDVLCLAEDGPQRLLEEREQAELVRRALGELERPDRELFVRHYYYGQTVARAAEEMGLNPSTAKTRLRRGREKLKEHLRKAGFCVEEAEDLKPAERVSGSGE